MIPTGKGPYLAEKFTTPEAREKLGAQPSDLLPGLFCPQCRVLVLFPSGTDLSQPLGGSDAEFRCECGYKGPLSPDLATGEYNCPECGLVVGESLDDQPPPPKDDE
jgi:hypothetical protein